MEPRFTTTHEPDPSLCYFLVGLRLARITRSTNRSVTVMLVPIQLSVELGPGGTVFRASIDMEVVSAFSSVPAYVRLVP